MDWERTGGTVYTVKTEKRISFNSCINNIVKLNTYCHICLVSLVKRSLKRHWRILVFFLSFFFIKGEWTGGWGWGKTYSTFKLFTHGDSGVTACLSLWDWKGVVGLKMEGEAALPLWNEPSKCNQQIVLLAIWQAWALGRMFCFFLLFYFSLPLLRRKFQVGAMFKSTGHQWRAVHVTKALQRKGETGPALPPCCWT